MVSMIRAIGAVFCNTNNPAIARADLPRKQEIAQKRKMSIPCEKTAGDSVLLRSMRFPELKAKKFWFRESEAA